MKKISKERIWLGSISVWILAVLNIVASPKLTWATILSAILLLVSVIAAILSLKMPQVAAGLNKWGYETEFLIVLLTGLFAGGRFSGLQIIFLAIAVVLFLISWLLNYKQNTESDD
jgi:hypothetical protein